MKTIARLLARILPIQYAPRATMEKHPATHSNMPAVGPAGLRIGINHEFAFQIIGHWRRPDVAALDLPGPVLRAQQTFKARSRFLSLVRREA